MNKLVITLCSMHITPKINISYDILVISWYFMVCRHPICKSFSIKKYIQTLLKQKIPLIHPSLPLSYSRPQESLLRQDKSPNCSIILPAMTLGKMSFAFTPSSTRNFSKEKSAIKQMKLEFVFKKKSIIETLHKVYLIGDMGYK